MIHNPGQILSTSPDHRWLSHRLRAVVALILTLLPFAALHAQAAPAWPYAALQAELNTTYATVQQAIAPLPTITMTNHYIVPLFWADGNAGVNLIGADKNGNPDGHLVSYNVQRCTQWLQLMKRAGFNSTMIAVAWPLLDPGGNYPGLKYYQAFYTQVTQQAKALGFWVLLTSGTAGTGSINYGRYASIDQVFAGRRRQAWWSATTLQPDWIVVGGEPSSDKLLLRGIPDVHRLTAAYWGAHFQALMAGKPSGTPTKYAGGAMPTDPQAYFDAVVATAVDGIDQHPFPLTGPGLPPGKQFWNTLLHRFDQAHAAGKALLITQTQAYKETTAELANHRLSYFDISLRDMWDGFQPQDQAFMTMWHQIILKKGVTGVAYWWANRTFVGGYIPYNPLLSYDAVAHQVDSSSMAKLQQPGYVLNAEGQLWASFVGTH